MSTYGQDRTNKLIDRTNKLLEALKILKNGVAYTAATFDANSLSG